MWWSLHKVIPYCFVLRCYFVYFKAAVNALILDFEKWVLSLLRVCHLVKHLLNSFFPIFAKYYYRIWPLERSLPAWSAPECCFFLSYSLFLVFGLNSSYICRYMWRWVLILLRPCIIWVYFSVYQSLYVLPYFL